MKLRRALLFSLASFALVLGAACGGSSATSAVTPSSGGETPTPVATPTPDLATLGAQYEVLVAPKNAAGHQNNADLNAMNKTKVGSPAFAAAVVKLRADLKVYVDASIKFNSDLLSFENELSPSQRADVETVRADLSKEIGDLESSLAIADNVSFLNSTYAAGTPFAIDDKALIAASAIVRSDLGLPPNAPVA